MKNKKRNAQYIAGLLVLVLTLSIGTVLAKQSSSKKKSAAKTSKFTQALCTKYRKWELTGTLTKNDRRNHTAMIEGCRKRFRNLMYSDLKSSAGMSGTKVRYSPDGKQPNKKACKAYRKWEVQGKLTKNSDDYGYVIEFCRKKFPSAMKNAR